MCVEAAVCFSPLACLTATKPPCVKAPAVRAFKDRIKRLRLVNGQIPLKGLQRLAIAQLGSNEIDEVIFTQRISLSQLCAKCYLIALTQPLSSKPKNTRKN